MGAKWAPVLIGPTPSSISVTRIGLKAGYTQRLPQGVVLLVWSLVGEVAGFLMDLSRCLPMKFQNAIASFPELLDLRGDRRQDCQKRARFIR